MNDAVYSRLAETINKHESDILKEWLNNQKAEGTLSKSLEADVQQQSREFLASLKNSLREGRADIMAAEWTELRDLLTNLSEIARSRDLLPRRQPHSSFLSSSHYLSACERRLDRTQTGSLTRFGRRLFCWTNWDCGRSRPTRKRAKPSFRASSKTCWSFRLRW